MLTIRVKNNTGRWSILESRSFSFIYADKDRDGLADYEEPFYGTNWLVFDTNSDYLADGVNVFTGLAALSNDTDGDGLSNIVEIAQGTSPILKDTDSDGVNDKDDPFPLNPLRWKIAPKNAADHTAPVITLYEPK